MELEYEYEDQQELNNYLSNKYNFTVELLEELQMKFSEASTINELSEPLIASLKNQNSLNADKINQQQKVIAALQMVEQNYLKIKHKKIHSVSTQTNALHKSKQTVQNKVISKNSDDSKSVPAELPRRTSKTLISKLTTLNFIYLDKPNIQSVGFKQMHNDQINPDVKSLINTNKIKYAKYINFWYLL